MAREKSEKVKNKNKKFETEQGTWENDDKTQDWLKTQFYNHSEDKNNPGPNPYSDKTDQDFRQKKTELKAA